MGWFRHPDATRFSSSHRQFEAVRAPDGHCYFDLPPEAAHHATAMGMRASGPPPEPPPTLDRDALVREITEEVERRLRSRPT